MNPPRLLTTALLCLAGCARLLAAPFDAVPFGNKFAGTNWVGVYWDDPREIHEVAVQFPSGPLRADMIRLEYWGSRWPEQRLPKNSQPGGADVGWMELGNWYTYQWRTADTEMRMDGDKLIFTFRPLNAKEHPNLKDYPADFRYTLKVRIVSSNELPELRNFEVFTDSELQPAAPVRLAWKQRPAGDLKYTAFNGYVLGTENISRLVTRVSVVATTNADPNTFDRTLVTVKNGPETFTFAWEDLKAGPLFLPDFGVAVLPDGDQRSYADVASAQVKAGLKTLYDRVRELPEQTWRAAWAGLPRKKSDIYLPLGLDGGRQRFRLDPDGTVRLRTNDRFLVARPGEDTPRLALEAAPVRFRFGPERRPSFRTLEEESLPICHAAWGINGVRMTETAFVTQLAGTKADGPPPPADATAVFLARIVFTNASATPQTAELPVRYKAAETEGGLTASPGGIWRLGGHARILVGAEGEAVIEENSPVWRWTLKPGETKTVLLKIPYVVLTNSMEEGALAKLDFDAELSAVKSYWHRRLDESARLITPEPMLNEFYRAHAGHLLINCEREPGAELRFARVGSFAYGAYGNESCMMVVDLDRRSYHKEAQECLDGWLKYQGTVALPGDFDSKAGVLYGAGGYEDGGYNQHHGWILWMLAEHYRFTRDDTWLRQAAPGMIAACDWVARQTARTQNRSDLERGLLPAGSLEDIGDWWTWLSTSSYTWRGLDSAAWALEQIHNPEAPRIRRAADDFHEHLIANFKKASERAPVVRLRDGTAVPQIPSYVQRRGRSFGWICQTLEGSMHLLITRALDARSREANWIIKDYEDNLYLSNQYGYTVPNFDEQWFSRGGMSMQACLLFDVEPYLYRDDVKNALRALFNAEAVSYFPDVRMNTEHAAPYFDDWRGDHYKSSDEANACGWLRQLFVREDETNLLIGQAVPREWLHEGKECGMERAATYFGPVNIHYQGGKSEITARLDGPKRNPPGAIRVRFREPAGAPIKSVTVNGKPWRKFNSEWVELPGNIGRADIITHYR